MNKYKVIKDKLNGKTTPDLKHIVTENHQLQLENASLKMQLNEIDDLIGKTIDSNNILSALKNQNEKLHKEYDKLLDEFRKVREEAIFILKGGTSKNYKGEGNE